MQEAYKIAAANAKKRMDRGKKYYDIKAKNIVLVPGDRVLVRNLGEKGGPGKLRSYWEDKVHIVVRRISNQLPVYEVRPENGKGRSRVLHRNLLLQCNHLPLEEDHRVQEFRRMQEKVRSNQRVQNESSSEYMPEFHEKGEGGKSYDLNPYAEPFSPREGAAEIEHTELEAGIEQVSSNEDLAPEALSDKASSTEGFESAGEQVSSDDGNSSLSDSGEQTGARHTQHQH